MSNLPINQKSEWTPSSEALEARKAHRIWIGGRAITLLSHYWRDDDDEALTEAMGQDWADVLEGIPRQYIQRACIKYQQQEPRKKPTPGAIYQLASEMTPRPQFVRPAPAPDPKRERIDAATAQAIVEAANYAPKRFGDGEPKA